ncbi:hypothetical protein N7520_005769 [Penicillium odoratum]|uniref:uncharacterized protein n=1 Tax=Penicillium odoratum TaxID=1167516 RepID=UPI00254910D8|nr:uncharacterized protein N7520_005769 [Penicillium odoratum]KAJ5758613.1 hypothetical protein N7520_005769 [Penicillium odoratum]
MQFTLPILLSLGLANAATLAQPSTWQISNWEIVSSGGTVYSFDIVAAASANSPGFNTHCEGIVPNATACDDTDVTATVTEQKHPLWNVAVQHEWHLYPEDESEQTYWQAGSKNVTSTQSNFTITPNVFYGVA